MLNKKKEYSYETALVNFKPQHKDIFDWMKDYCDKNGISVSDFIRNLIKKFKEEKEENKK